MIIGEMKTTRDVKSLSPVYPHSCELNHSRRRTGAPSAVLLSFRDPPGSLSPRHPTNEQAPSVCFALESTEITSPPTPAVKGRSRYYSENIPGIIRCMKRACVRSQVPPSNALRQARARVETGTCTDCHTYWHRERKEENYRTPEREKGGSMGLMISPCERGCVRARRRLEQNRNAIVFQ